MIAVSATIEAVTGVVLLAIPETVIEALIGPPSDDTTSVVARVLGGALLSLGVVGIAARETAGRGLTVAFIVLRHGYRWGAGERRHLGYCERSPPVACGRRAPGAGICPRHRLAAGLLVERVTSAPRPPALSLVDCAKGGTTPVFA